MLSRIAAGDAALDAALDAVLGPAPGHRLLGDRSGDVDRRHEHARSARSGRGDRPDAVPGLRRMPLGPGRRGRRRGGRGRQEDAHKLRPGQVRAPRRAGRATRRSARSPWARTESGRTAARTRPFRSGTNRTSWNMVASFRPRSGSFRFHTGYKPRRRIFPIRKRGHVKQSGDNAQRVHVPLLIKCEGFRGMPGTSCAV